MTTVFRLGSRARGFSNSEKTLEDKGSDRTARIPGHVWRVARSGARACGDESDDGMKGGPSRFAERLAGNRQAWKPPHAGTENPWAKPNDTNPNAYLPR